MTATPTKSTASIAHSENLQGISVDETDPAALREALDLAFDYRGDITIVRRSTNQSIEGYLFDRRFDATTEETHIRIMPKDSNDRITVALSDIASLRFSGKDTASGKTFDHWIRKYTQNKLAGEAANIESESLD